MVTLSVFETLASYAGAVLPAHRVAASASFYEALFPAIERFRTVSFEFLEDVVEPATANAWIESGGVS